MFALAVSATPGMGSGIVGLFLESGWMGKVIVVILMGVSVVTWAMILMKYQYLRKAEQESKLFMARVPQDQGRSGASEVQRKKRSSAPWPRCSSKAIGRPNPSSSRCRTIRWPMRTARR